MQRRHFLKELIAGAVASSVLKTPLVEAAFSNQAPGPSSHTVKLRFLRPPGSLTENEFKKRCIRCGQCGEVCPNTCIRYFNTENGFDSLNTPYIIPREKACILCMKCGDICPTGAISEVKRDANEIIKHVQMGKAQVNKSLCLSYQGKSCGVCWRACPLQDVAIKVGWMEQPYVLSPCVGCGLCERSCIQIPQAIKVIPTHNRKAKTI